jgi:hypothetical protein
MARTGANPSNSNGNVGGLTWCPQAIPTVTANSAYTSGNIVGGKMTFENAFLNFSGVISSLTIVDRSQQAAAMNIYFFAQDLVGTYADKTSFSLNASDIENIIGVFQVSSGNYITSGGISIVTLYGLATPVCSNGRIKSLYAVAVTTGTPTYTTTTALIFMPGVLQD